MTVTFAKHSATKWSGQSDRHLYNGGMKFSRVLFSVLTGLLVSLFLASTFFHLSDFPSLIDRFFLTFVPAAAISLILFEGFPSLSAWANRIKTSISIPHFLLSFLVTLIVTYGFVGFLQEPLRTPFNMALFTVVFTVFGSAAGYLLVQQAARSLREGFLSKPINLLLALSLPVFLVALTASALQFPSMFVWEYIRVPPAWTSLFLLATFTSAILSLFLFTHSFPLSDRLSSLFSLPSFLHNVPGLYAAGMFFLIELIIARTLNHPALTYNTVLFEADAGPWMEILASPQGGAINRSVHPLSLLLLRPLIRLVSGVMGGHYALGGMLVVSAVAGLCVFMTWLFAKRATDSKTYAFLFAILLGSTATHLLFGSLTENYIFGAAALILFFLLLQSGEKRFIALVPAGLLLFGITITNIAQGVIALFFNKFGFKRLVQYSILVLALGTLLTSATSLLHPNKQTLFFVPGDIAFEFNFVRSSNGNLSDPMRLSEPESIIRKFNIVSRSILLYGMVGPQVVEAVSEKPPFPTIDLKTYDVRTKAIASYKGLANLPLAMWLIFLSSGFLLFVKKIRTFKHTPLALALLGVIAFNFLLHLLYGTELFLYTSYWVYAFVLFLALAFSDLANKKWFQWGSALIVLALMINNFGFLVSILHALAPFYAAAP